MASALGYRLASARKFAFFVVICDFHMMACLHSVVVNNSSDPNLFFWLMQRFCLHELGFVTDVIVPARKV